MGTGAAADWFLSPTAGTQTIGGTWDSSNQLLIFCITPNLFFLLNHRIIKEKTSKIIQVQLPTYHQYFPTNNVPLSTTSPQLLNTSRDSDSITSLCQCPTTLLEEKLFLIPNLNLPSKPEAIPSHPITVTWEKRPTSFSPQHPFRSL